MNEEQSGDEDILYVYRYILRCLLGLFDASLYAYRAFSFVKKATYLRGNVTGLLRVFHPRFIYIFFFLYWEIYRKKCI